MISGTMAGNTSGLLFILLMVTACLIMVSGCTAGNPPVVTVSPTQTPPPPVVTTASATPQSCMTDDECVPAQCCHPTSCTNKANKGVCNLMCTMSCEGPIDCGAGELWVCEREMQCRSLGNIIPYNGYKTSVIVPLP